MRLRCLAFLPPAAFVTGLILMLTSSIVSGLESTLTASEPANLLELVRYETECEFLERRIEEIARDVETCEALPGCLQSENICPVSMQSELELEYERLREAVEGRCTGVSTFVTRVSATCTALGGNCSIDGCGGSISGEARLQSASVPEVFLF